MGQGVQVVQLTNSSFFLGLWLVAPVLPRFLFASWGGVIADRINRRMVVITGNSVYVVLALGLGILTTLHRVAFWHIFLTESMFYIVNSLESVSWRTLRGDLVPADQIKQATAIIELLIACAQVLGFMIGGIVVALTGVAGTYYFSAITYFLAIVGFFFVHPLHHHVKTTVQRTSYRLRDGISYILQYRWMQKILLLQSFAIILIGACLTLLPIIVQNTFHVSSIALGVMKAMVGTGYLAMSVWLVLASHRIQKPARILTIMCVVGGICGLAFAFTHDFVLCLPLLFILGVCVAPSMTVTDLLLQTGTPREMRGRVMSVWFIITSGADSLGAFAIGALAQALGISQAIGLMAGLGLLGTLMCLVAYRTEK